MAAPAQAADRKLKGLSPLIAVVILIGMVLALGAIIWGTVEQINKQGEKSAVLSARCAEAKVIIHNGVYDRVSKNLTLSVYNYGQVDLAISPLLMYTDLSRHNSLIQPLNDMVIDMPAGEAKKFSIANVDDDLEQVSIKSVECARPGCYRCDQAQDLLLDTNIIGL